MFDFKLLETVYRGQALQILPAHNIPTQAEFGEFEVNLDNGGFARFPTATTTLSENIPRKGVPTLPGSACSQPSSLFSSKHCRDAEPSQTEQIQRAALATLQLTWTSWQLATQIRDTMNNVPAARALHKDMAQRITYGTVSPAMETWARTITAKYTSATPHEQVRAGACKSTASSVIADFGNIQCVFSNICMKLNVDKLT